MVLMLHGSTENLRPCDEKKVVKKFTAADLANNKGKPQQSYFFSGPATKGGRVRAWPLGKNNFFEALKNPPKRCGH